MLVAFVDAVIREQVESPTPPIAASFSDVLTALYTTGYTGRVYVDFANGRPKVVSLPQPVSVQVQN